MTKAAAFIGLGRMGMPMAENLLDSGIPLFVYNRSPEKAIALSERGAHILSTPSEAFYKSTIVFSMLANDNALYDVACGPEGLLETISAGSIHVSMSTVSPETTKQLALLHKEKGAYFVAAPVFGRPDAARGKKLIIALAGDPAAKKSVEPLLHLLGQRIDDFGSDPATASVVKLCGNFLLLSAIEAMGEAAHLGEAYGVGSAALLSYFAETLFSCPAYQNYSKIIAGKNFEPAGFTMALGLKDINLAKASAESAQLSLPLLKLLQTIMEEGNKRGKGHLDWSAISLFSKD